jgi:hypothetical protein
MTIERTDASELRLVYALRPFHLFFSIVAALVATTSAVAGFLISELRWLAFAFAAFVGAKSALAFLIFRRSAATAPKSRTLLFAQEWYGLSAAYTVASVLCIASFAAGENSAAWLGAPVCAAMAVTFWVAGTRAGSGR